MTTLAGLIREPTHRVFRRAAIKRRSATTGLYEADWYDITDYVKAWGNFTIAVDDTRLNRFTHSGYSFRVKNDTGAFNHESVHTSLWNGYLTRYRTLVRIQAGYLDGSTEYPTDTTQGIFIMGAENSQNQDTNEMTFNCKSIISPFEETRADEIAGIATGSLTASQIMTKIRDATDGSSGYLFRNFITSTSWSIQTTANALMNLNTTTILQNYSVWELMSKLAEAENFVIYATRTGGIVFGDRAPNTTGSQFSFYGGKFNRPNIIQFGAYKEAVNKLYTHVRMKYLEADTTTSYINRGTTTAISGSNLSWKYGRRTYEFEDTFFSSDVSAAIASKLMNEFGNLRNEAEMVTKFIPELDILDRIDVSYRETNLTGSRLWDTENWASDAAATATDGLSWDDETGTSLEFWEKGFKVLSKETDLDNFKTKLVIREAEN